MIYLDTSSISIELLEEGVPGSPSISTALLPTIVAESDQRKKRSSEPLGRPGYQMGTAQSPFGIRGGSHTTFALFSGIESRLGK
jgi:hypothetical protein